VTITDTRQISMWSGESGIFYRKSIGSLNYLAATPNASSIFFTAPFPDEGFARFRPSTRQPEKIDFPLDTKKRPHRFLPLSDEFVIACDTRSRSVYELKLPPAGNGLMRVSWEADLPIKGRCSAIGTSPDNQILVGTTEGEIIWLDTETRRVTNQARISGHDFLDITHIAAAKDFVVVSMYKKFAVLKASRAEPIIEYNGGAAMRNIAPDGSAVLAVDTRETPWSLMKWDLVTGRTKAIECQLCKIVSISTNDRMLVLEAYKYRAELWDPRTLEIVADLGGFREDVDEVIDLSPQGIVLGLRKDRPSILLRVDKPIENTVPAGAGRVASVSYIDSKQIAVTKVTSEAGNIKSASLLAFEWSNAGWKSLPQPNLRMGTRWPQLLPFEHGLIAIYFPESFYFNMEKGIFSAGQLTLFDTLSQQYLVDDDVQMMPIVDRTNEIAVVPTSADVRLLDLRTHQWKATFSGTGGWSLVNNLFAIANGDQINIRNIRENRELRALQTTLGRVKQLCIEPSAEVLSAVIEG
jgi:hypothetical protein